MVTTIMIIFWFAWENKQKAMEEYEKDPVKAFRKGHKKVVKKSIDIEIALRVMISKEKQRRKRGYQNMRMIEFGKDKDKISEIVMGLMRISDMNSEDVAALVKTGLEQGINFLDTADCYGHGRTKKEWYEIYLSAGNTLP